MSEQKKKPWEISKDEIFSLGWFYDDSQDTHVLKALEDFDLREISTAMINHYPPRVNVRDHLQHLNDELIKRGLATSGLTHRRFTWDEGETSPVSKLVEDGHFYHGRTKGAGEFKPYGSDE